MGSMGVYERTGIPTSDAAVRERVAQAIGAIANVEEVGLWRAWKEFEYRIDVCKVTNGAYIKICI
jgi:hypothetical protein